MRINEYEKLAMRTKNDLDHDKNMMNAVLGLNGEAGEIADIIKKAKYQGHELDRNKLIKEIGDIMWYVALMCDSIGIDMELVAKKNIEKLVQRYPNGFREEDSINRREEPERENHLGKRD
jgi:NTP pyrophosphatase (non-canonical NTP hydrolase)